ncbi:MAG: SLC13 family permease [Vulcanimicrobiota bacterium]
MRRSHYAGLFLFLLLCLCLGPGPGQMAQIPGVAQAQELGPVPVPTTLPMDHLDEHPPEHESPYHGLQGATRRSKIVFGILLALILLIMSLEVVDKSIVTMIGAMVCLGLAYSPWFELITHDKGGHGQAPFYISTIDWSTIGVIIGTSIFVEIASRSGIFTWSALRLTKSSGGDPFRLLLLYSLLTVLFSAFLNNVTAMIIVGSLTVVSCRKLELQPLPFLFTEGLLTNVGGLLTLISSIPNIIVGTTANISFMRFVLLAAPYTFLAAVVTVFYAKWKFPEVRSLESEDEIKFSAEQVASFDEKEAIKDKRFFITAWFGMAAVILGFAFQSSLPILRDMGLEAVALGAAALFLLLFAPHKVEEAVDTVEWSLVLFFASLFVIIGVMELAGVLSAIGDGLKLLLNLPQVAGASAILWSSALASSVTDNIPLAVVLSKILSLMQVPSDSVLWWSVIFGANLGGNITPIGSASTVVAMTVIKKEGIELSFLGFVRMAVPFALIQLVLATIYLLLLMGLHIVS